MKKVLLATAFSLLSFAAVAQPGGGFNGPSNQGGFTGPGVGGQVTTVQNVKSMRDDSWVVLQGYIEQRLGDDLYLFRDSTGTIHVDIDNKHWYGQTISPTDKVEIHGEVDKDWNSVEVDVKQLIKLSK